MEGQEIHLCAHFLEVSEYVFEVHVRLTFELTQMSPDQTYGYTANIRGQILRRFEGLSIVVFDFFMDIIASFSRHFDEHLD